MEGLAGTAIRLAVRDLSCPQGPGPGWSSVAPVSGRGPILRVAQATTTLTSTSPFLAQPGRRVARDRGGRCREPDLYLQIKPWLPFTAHPAPAAGGHCPPAAILVKGSWSADRYSGLGSPPCLASGSSGRLPSQRPRATGRHRAPAPPSQPGMRPDGQAPPSFLRTQLPAGSEAVARHCYRSSRRRRCAWDDSGMRPATTSPGIFGEGSRPA
jgi:hypothetical protein